MALSAKTLLIQKFEGFGWEKDTALSVRKRVGPSYLKVELMFCRPRIEYPQGLSEEHEEDYKTALLEMMQLLR